MNGKNVKTTGYVRAALNRLGFSADYSLFAIRYSLRKGQILIPSILVIPSLMLFIYLLFETTKISREKIRQQFALDSAAFIQMGDYTNILNRTAYVNGAFPYRIFKEAYECTAGCANGTEENCLKDTPTDGQHPVCTYKMLYDSGAIPKYKEDEEFKEATSLDNKPKWSIAFNETSRNPMNKNPPTPGEVLTLTTFDQGKDLYLFWDPAIGIYKFYAQVYTMLGAVEESQMTVFEHLTENFNFFRKSYYLNANTSECVENPDMCGEDGVRSPGGFRTNRFTRNTSMFMWYVDKVTFHAKEPMPGLPPYRLATPGSPVQMPAPGLFQIATFSDSALKTIGNPGYNVYQGWEPPKNYFGVDFRSKAACKETGRPCVHALVASQCPQLADGNNCVWPDPTPKYQTRLYP
jgi:hypothetical protein